jgi:DNA topoisomerase-2
VKPSDIKNHIRIFISANINRPKFSSQTKENMISPVSEWKTTWAVSDKFIKSLLKTEVVQSVLDWVSAKEKAQLMADLRKANKNVDKNDPKKVDKFHDATTKDRENALLFIVEGDSALSGVLSGRDTKTMGAFPLRGKPINVTPMDLKDILDNKEFKNIMTITGLQFGEKIKSPSDLRFGKIILTSDADLDGFSIRGLLINAFYKFWPELFDLGMIGILNTPIVKVFMGKQIISFYTLDDFESWKLKNQTVKYTTKYFKGLGTSSSKEWKEYLLNIDSNIDIINISSSDEEIFQLLFSKEAGMTDKRKSWLNIEA